MKTLSKALLAITGLAVSVACAPAFKGEGTKKPNLQRLLKIQEKALETEAKELAHIKSVKRTKNKLGEGYRFTFVLENVPDLKKKKDFVILNITEPNNAVNKTYCGKSRIYTIETRCLDNCEKFAAVLTSEPRKKDVVKSALKRCEGLSGDENSAYKEDEERDEDVEVAQEESGEESEKESKESEETALETQVGTTAGAEAPPVNLSKLEAPVVIQTGVIANSKEDKIEALRPLDPEMSFEEQIPIMQGLIVQKQMLKMK